MALIPSLIWLALIASYVWSTGGLRSFLLGQLGLFGQHFFEWGPPDGEPRDVRFGFQLLGHRFLEKRIPLDKIESVEWCTGQATDIAGREMNDWQVWVWFDHDDPKRGEAQRKRRYRKPDQDLYGVDPSGPRDRTEALCLSLVSLLRRAGVDLIQGASATCFVRQAGSENGDAH